LRHKLKAPNAYEPNVIKILQLSFMIVSNKLERLSLPSLSSLVLCLQRAFPRGDKLKGVPLGQAPCLTHKY
jgi:hypothetical protein